MIFEDRIQANPRLFRLKDPRTNEIVDFEIQDLLPEEIVQEGNEIDAAYLNGLLTYSENEKIIGYWTDGKPVYQKVITSVLNGTYTEDGFFFTWISSGISNIKNIIRKDISVKTASGTQISFEGSENLKLDYIITGSFANNVQIGAKSNAIPVGSPVIIVLQYTKTTD